MPVATWRNGGKQQQQQLQSLVTSEKVGRATPGRLTPGGLTPGRQVPASPAYSEAMIDSLERQMQMISSQNAVLEEQLRQKPDSRGQHLLQICSRGSSIVSGCGQSKPPTVGGLSTGTSCKPSPIAASAARSGKSCSPSGSIAGSAEVTGGPSSVGASVVSGSADNDGAVGSSVCEPSTPVDQHQQPQQHQQLEQQHLQQPPQLHPLQLQPPASNSSWQGTPGIATASPLEAPPLPLRSPGRPGVGRISSRSPPPPATRFQFAATAAGGRPDSRGRYRAAGGAQQQHAGSSQSFPGPALPCPGGHPLLAQPIGSVAAAISAAASRPVAGMFSPQSDSPRDS